jgi:peptide/nickel transport system ATP-binding protein
LNGRPEKLTTVDEYMQAESIDSNRINIEPLEKRIIKQEEIYAKTPILKVENLVKRFALDKPFFGKVKNFVNAVDCVNLDVYPGETLGLVGESGCGKTTLGRSILRLVEPDSGKILFEEKDILHLNQQKLKQERKNINIVFQDPYSSLNPRLSIGNAIVEPMRVHGLFKSRNERKQKALELLEKVGLEAMHFHRYPHEFSGGQRQRIVIARALALNPKFIICDEAVSALDVSVQAKVLNLLNDLKKEFGFTYIFISHDLSVVRFMSDRIMVMKDGQIVEVGDADEVYHKPKTDYTKQLIQSIPKGI